MLVTALILMTVMLGLGLAVMSMSDTQTRQTGRQRANEARLNLTESVVSSSIFALSRNWPATATGAYPECTQASTNAAFCPNPARVLEHHAGQVDFKQGSAWSVRVLDNGGTSRDFFSSATLSQPTWDAGGDPATGGPDGQMWIRAEGLIDGRPRVIVAKVRVEQVPMNFPSAPFVAGSMAVSNAGGHGGRPVIDGSGKPGIVRCGPVTAPTCTQFINDGRNKNQVPNGVVSDPNLEANIVSPEILDSLRQTAQANGTYYETGCPQNPSGSVVYVANANCSFTAANGTRGGACPSGNSCVNSASQPSVFIIERGTWTCTGNVLWYGVVYLVNSQNSSGTVFDNRGNCTVQGGVFVDGPGRMEVGSNAPNLVYDPNLVLNSTAYGTAGIVQNTWREYYGD